MFAVSPSSKSETRQAAGKAEGRQSGPSDASFSHFLWEQLTEPQTAQAAGELSLVILCTLCEGGEERQSKLGFAGIKPSLISQPPLKSFFSRWLIYVVL